MSDRATHLQKRRSGSTMNECVTNNGHAPENSTCSPGNREQIPLTPALNTFRYALGAGNRQFESGHPENGLFVQ